MTLEKELVKWDRPVGIYVIHNPAMDWGSASEVMTLPELCSSPAHAGTLMLTG